MLKNWEIPKELAGKKDGVYGDVSAFLVTVKRGLQQAMYPVLLAEAERLDRVKIDALVAGAQNNTAE